MLRHLRNLTRRPRINSISSPLFLFTDHPTTVHSFHTKQSFHTKHSLLSNMHFSTTLIAAVAALFASTTIAHPGHDHSAEIAARSSFLGMSTTKRDLSHCSAKLKARGVEARGIERRSKIAQKERAKRALKKRSSDLDTVLNTTHLSSVDYSPLDSENAVFTSNSSCILQPEVTQGPYCKFSMRPKR